MDNSVDAEYEFGKCDTTEQLTSRVGTHNAARLLVLRSRLQDRAMFAVYPGDDNIVLPRSAELWRRMQP